MEYDKSRVYTALNADELKVGSKVIVANTIKDLKRKVEENVITEIKSINADCYENRFSAWYEDDILGYALAYLVSEPEEKKLKWTDLNIGDVITNGSITAMVTEIDNDCSDNAHIHIGNRWFTDYDLTHWKKVKEND